ncbi:MAG: hypothetical protein E4H10_00040 [Bacteroidia bacterium]|nr:MAG: hypothetical protein E4H10_00040 [Bacteroidia bacterium]
MKKVLLLILLFTVLAASLQAQEEIPSRKGKIFLIPEVWLSFGTRTYIEVAPMVGYHINNRLSVGLGPHFIYESQKAYPPYPAYETWAYGLKGFVRFAIITNAEEFLPIKLFSDLFVHVEYEGLSLEKTIYIPPITMPAALSTRDFWWEAVSPSGWECITLFLSWFFGTSTNPPIHPMQIQFSE